ncbi:DUF2510 domain-containing protein [Nocardia nova]|nr:DUF2510 domain-containing protein [Nocardia nova]
MTSTYTQPEPLPPASGPTPEPTRYQKFEALRKKWQAPIIVLSGIGVFGYISNSADVSPDHLLIILAIFGVPITAIVLVVRALIRVGDKRPPPMVIAQPPAVAPPPGFYPDQAGVMRWFDGQRWTEFTK